MSESASLVRILGIESSCDETSAAIVESGCRLLSSVVASQIAIHAKFGGVYPEVASRQHILAIAPVVEEALHNAHLTLDEIQAIAVTRGPGLAGSLVVGLNFAKGLALARQLPIIGINHLEGHIYSAWINPTDTVEEKREIEFPILALLVSGGHTELILMKDHFVYQKLGGTLDDAAGEAFDKVARLLSLPYPGGPSIQEAALKGNPSAFQFPRARLEGTWDFSFSGLKTAVLRIVQHLQQEGKPLPVEDIAASFQEAVVGALFTKTIHAAQVNKVKKILIAGGVSANEALRNVFVNQSNFEVVIPQFRFCTDNAAMVAAAGYFRFLKYASDALDMDVVPNWSLTG